MSSKTDLVDSTGNLKLCDEMRANNALEQDVMSIEIGNPIANGAICPWGQADNADKHNGHIAARIEQKKRVNLPEGAVVCGLKLNFADQNMLYDDLFFMTFNDAVIASSASWAVDYFDSQDIDLGSHSIAVKKYDWSKLRDKQHPADVQSVSYDYCLADDLSLGDCSWPLTEHEGQIEMAMDNDLVAALGSLPAEALDIGFVTTGDDNAESDCGHEPLNFSVTVDYFVQ